MGGQFNLNGIPPARRGEPQIEVTLEIDSNGILNVSAIEKAGGKSESITITNDAGRLSKEDIEQMVKNAEKYKSEDEAIKKKIDARNTYEHYIYNVKNTIETGNLQDKFEASDKATIAEAVKTHQQWLDSNSDASAEEYESRMKDLEKLFQPIMSKVYGQQESAPGANEKNFGGNNFNATNEGYNAEPNANVDDLD